MKKIILSSLLVAGISIGSIQPSHAIVGALISAPAVSSIGAVAFLAGWTLGVSSVIADTDALDKWSDILWKGGLIMFDAKSDLDAEFPMIDPAHAQSFGAQASEVEIYNDELDQLNAVRKTVQAESPNGASFAEVAEIWKSHADEISPETLKVAGLFAKSTLETSASKK